MAITFFGATPAHFNVIDLGIIPRDLELNDSYVEEPILDADRTGIAQHNIWLSLLLKVNCDTLISKLEGLISLPIGKLEQTYVIFLKFKILCIILSSCAYACSPYSRLKKIYWRYFLIMCLMLIPFLLSKTPRLWRKLTHTLSLPYILREISTTTSGNKDVISSSFFLILLFKKFVVQVQLKQFLYLNFLVKLWSGLCSHYLQARNKGIFTGNSWNESCPSSSSEWLKSILFFVPLLVQYENG